MKKYLVFFLLIISPLIMGGFSLSFLARARANNENLHITGEHLKPDNSIPVRDSFEVFSPRFCIGDSETGLFCENIKKLESDYREKKIDKKTFFQERCGALLVVKEKLPQQSEARKKIFELAARDFNKTNEYWDIISVSTRDFCREYIERHKLIKKGDVVADIGCGQGYYLYYFLNLVGEKGKVYGVDIDPYCLDFVRSVRKWRDHKNLTLIQNVPDDVMLKKDSVDFAFLCGVDPYCLGILYNRPDETGHFTKSIHHAMKKGGILFISNSGDSEEYVDENLNKAVEFIEKHGPFKVIYSFQKVDEYVMIFKKI